MNNFSGEGAFQYNPAITNVNIDNSLAGILTQFNDDYVSDVIDESIENRLRIFDLPMPNIVGAYETTFKEITNGFASFTAEIAETRRRTYLNIINKICNYYNLAFEYIDTMDLYSIAYALYEFFISKFTTNLINFYVNYLIAERDSLERNMNLTSLRKDNDAVYQYSKTIFKDVKIAAIHANIDYVIDQMSVFDIDLWTILSYAYPAYTSGNLSNYIYGSVRDNGNFFKDFYESFINNPELLTYVKLGLSQAGALIEPVED